VPELPEVERLRSQLDGAWRGRLVSRITAPKRSPDPTRYFQGEWSRFTEVLQTRRMLRVMRLGKNLWIPLDGKPSMAWHIHLSSTGWFVAGNFSAGLLFKPFHKNFIHDINEKNVRVRMHLDDGQLWNYHDPRTWGKWYFRLGSLPRDDAHLNKLGPDWQDDENGAIWALKTYDGGGSRPVKTVLLDQTLTAGIGNYLACEIMAQCGIHPHSLWGGLTSSAREGLAEAAGNKVRECLLASDHDHWRVFKKKGDACWRCGGEIGYVKDLQGGRGSYFCGRCQCLTEVVHQN
jgi:formamidopyrimidine-DNA glycosylase